MPPVFSNAREYVNCGNMWAKRCGFIVLQKILLITKLQSSTPFLQSGRAGKVGVMGRGGGEGEKKKKERVKGKREKERECEGCISKFLQQFDGGEQGPMWNHRGQRWISLPCEKVVNQDGLSNDHFLLKLGGSGWDNSADVLDEFGTKMSCLPPSPL